MIVAFTGHRPAKLGGYKDNPLQQKIRKAIEDTLLKLKPEKAISGMALGVDQWAAEICLKLEIPFLAAVPFVGQESVWPKESQEKYRELLRKADSIFIVSPAPYAAWKLQKRNEWMVDHCDKLIAIWDGTAGGTGNCVEYAKKIGREVYRIDPNDT
jgi:uncharacterized phage-like protein YoqJ